MYKLRLTSTGGFLLTGTFINDHVANAELDYLNAPKYVQIRSTGTKATARVGDTLRVYNLGYLSCNGRFYNNDKTLNVTGKKRLDWIVKKISFEVITPSWGHSITLEQYLNESNREQKQ